MYSRGKREKELTLIRKGSEIIDCQYHNEPVIPCKNCFFTEICWRQEMKCLVVIEEFTKHRIKALETKAAAEMWLRNELRILKKKHHLHPWDEKWAIYVFKEKIMHNPKRKTPNLFSTK